MFVFSKINGLVCNCAVSNVLVFDSWQTFLADINGERINTTYIPSWLTSMEVHQHRKSPWAGTAGKYSQHGAPVGQT